MKYCECAYDFSKYVSRFGFAADDTNLSQSFLPQPFISSLSPSTPFHFGNSNNLFLCDCVCVCVYARARLGVRVHVLSSLMGVCAWNARHNLHLWRKSKHLQALGQRLPLQQLQTPTCPLLSPRVLLLHSRRCVYVCVYIHFTITGTGACVCIYTSQSQVRLCVCVCIYFTITGTCVRVCIYIHMCEYMCITMCPRLSPQVLQLHSRKGVCVCVCVFTYV